MLITLDMTRADHLRPYGYSKATTQAIDRVAAEGAVFESAYTPSTLSAPAHASMLTGLHPNDHGLHDNVHKLSPAVAPVAERLAAAGYETAGFVSSGLVGEKVGLSRGFQTFELHEDLDHVHKTPSLEKAQRVYKAAAAWLRAHPTRSFLWVHVQSPHFDFRPPEAFDQMFVESKDGAVPPFDCIWELNKLVRRGMAVPEDAQRLSIARYDAEIALADTGIGFLLDALEESGAAPTTAVFIAADHGATLFDRIPDGATVDHLEEFYEEVVRVPLIMRVPGQTPARVPGHVEITSIAPTIAELAGLPPQRNVKAPSLMAAVKAGHGASPFPKTAWIYSRNYKSIRVGDWKLSVRNGDRLLFDVSKDPAEKHNLAGQEPARLKVLEEQLAALYEERKAAREKAPAEKVAADPATLEMLRQGGYLDQLKREHDE